MGISTAEVVATYAPLGAEGILALKSPRTAAKTGQWVYSGAAEAPKPYGFKTWGSEYIDDAIRGAEMPFNPTGGLNLNFSVEQSLGTRYKAISEVTVPIKNTSILEQLNATSKGDWVKVYEAGLRDQKKIEVHYFRNNKTKEVFDVKIKYEYWHQNKFKKLN
jgi:hypothetical protein